MAVSVEGVEGVQEGKEGKKVYHESSLEGVRPYTFKQNAIAGKILLTNHAVQLL